MVEGVEALHTEANDPVGGNGSSVGEEPNTTRIVVLLRVIERVLFHDARLGWASEAISCERFHKIDRTLALHSTVCGVQQRQTSKDLVAPGGFDGVEEVVEG
jgi:hypothetical protein